jgi:GNAT superfamily N-acetyltransferase
MNDMGDVTLRPFGREDLQSVRALIVSTIDACYTPFYPPRAIEFFRHYHSDENILKRAEEGFTIVGEARTGLVATGSLVAAHISAVFVLRAAQGRGLGRKGMEQLDEKARSDRWGEVTLDVSLPSKRFYERLGYRLGEHTYLDVGEGQRLEYWKATKELIPERA